MVDLSFKGKLETITPGINFVMQIIITCVAIDHKPDFLVDLQGDHILFADTIPNRIPTPFFQSVDHTRKQFRTVAFIFDASIYQRDPLM